MTFRIPRSRSRYARTTILSRVICQISGDRIQRGSGSPHLPGAGRCGVKFAPANPSYGELPPAFARGYGGQARESEPTAAAAGLGGAYPLAQTSAWAWLWACQ